jgi:hypothetical protein
MKKMCGYLIGVAIIVMCTTLEARSSSDCWLEWDSDKRAWYKYCESDFTKSKFKNCSIMMAYLERQISYYEIEFGDLLEWISELENTLAGLETRAEALKKTNQQLVARETALQRSTLKLTEEKPDLQFRERVLKFEVAFLEQEKQHCLDSAKRLEKGQMQHGARIDTLTGLNTAYQPFFEYVMVYPDDMDGLNGPHVVFSGANVHIRSGVGETTDMYSGLGNLIIGYNEDTAGALRPRTGAHNLIVGPNHSYSAYGGFVAGLDNTISGIHATVSGGSMNEAHGEASSVSGGEGNTARGLASSVSGGRGFTVEDDYAYAP